MCICIYMHSRILAIKKNEILPFATVLMDLKSIRLSEITQRKTNTLYHLFVESMNKCL